MKELKILRTTIVAGLEKPVELLHITDSHIVLDDERKSDRRRHFDHPEGSGQLEDYLRQALAYAEERKMPVVHTGDLIDYTSDAALAFADRELATADHMYAAGNHDFCHWVGEATEDVPYKWKMMQKVAPHFRTNLVFDSRIIGGLNVVTMDDSYYQITDGQIDALRAEVARGYPILLCMHVPLYTPELARLGDRVAYVLGAPESLLSIYPEKRVKQQRPDAATQRAVEYILNEPKIIGVLAGHKHVNYEEPLENGVMQYSTGGTFEGWARHITVI